MLAAMATIEPPQADQVRRLRGAAGGRPALGGGRLRPRSRVVAVRPLSSAWLANHAVDVADAAGAVHGWSCAQARPGWDVDDPDFTAAAERRPCRIARASPRARRRWSRPTPTPPSATCPPCSSPASPAAPARPRGRPRRWSGWPRPFRPSTPSPGPASGWCLHLPPLLRARAAGSAGLVSPAQAVAAGVRDCRQAAAGRPRLLHPPRLPPGQHPVGGRPPGRGGRLNRRVVGAALGRPRPHAAQPRLGPRAGGRRPVPGRPPGLTGFDHHPCRDWPRRSTASPSCPRQDLRSPGSSGWRTWSRPPWPAWAARRGPGALFLLLGGRGPGPRPPATRRPLRLPAPIAAGGRANKRSRTVERMTDTGRTRVAIACQGSSHRLHRRGAQAPARRRGAGRGRGRRPERHLRRGGLRPARLVGLLDGDPAAAGKLLEDFWADNSATTPLEQLVNAWVLWAAGLENLVVLPAVEAYDTPTSVAADGILPQDAGAAGRLRAVRRPGRRLGADAAHPGPSTSSPGSSRRSTAGARPSPPT